MIRSKIIAHRKQDIIVDGVTAKVNNGILNGGEKILGKGCLKEILDKAVGSKPIIYALYKNDDLYYIGQSNRGSLARIWEHIEEKKHKGKWNKFAVYRVSNKRYLDHVESILIRIAEPKGNDSRGRFVGCEDLTQQIKKQFIENFNASLADMKSKLKNMQKEYDKEKSIFDKKEENLEKYYKRKIDPLKDKNTPKAVERRKQWKREKKLKTGTLEAEKKEKLTPLFKQKEAKEADVNRLQKLIASTKKLA